MYSKIAEASCALVSQCRRSNSSSCKVREKLCHGVGLRLRLRLIPMVRHELFR